MAAWRRPEGYWDGVGIEGYAQGDLKAFIRKIRQIKGDEMRR